MAAAQIGAIQQCSDYKNQPTVQAGTTLVGTDNTALAATVGQIASLHAQLTGLEATRDQLVVKVVHDQRNVEAAITLACGGNADSIKAYGCVPVSRTARPPSTEAPTV